MSKISRDKLNLAQQAIEKVGLGKLEVSPYPCKIKHAPDDVTVTARDPQKRKIYVFLRRSEGFACVYGEIGDMPGSLPMGLAMRAHQRHYRSVFWRFAA